MRGWASLACLSLLLACHAPAPPVLPAPTSAPATELLATREPLRRQPPPAELGAALASLDAAARASESDAVVLLLDGAIVFERRYSAEGALPIESMSITKSLSALALAFLADEGELADWEQPLWRWFPEWRQGQKQDITLMHLMTHRTGLRDDNFEELSQSPDVVQLALCAELASAPGALRQYNNRASNLLAEIVRRQSGSPLDRYLARRLFAPLSIHRYEWLRDPARHPLVQSGLKIDALELARIGELLRLRGRFGGEQLVSEQALARLLPPQAGADGEGLFFWDAGHGAFAARGYLGQLLLVWPARGLVLVRLRQWRPGAEARPDEGLALEAQVLRDFSPGVVQAQSAVAE